MKPGFWVLCGAVSAFLSVALGAFAAHGLSTRLEPRLLEVFKTGAQYQMYHALALIGLGVWLAQLPSLTDSFGNAAGWLFALGSLVFSGSLYLLAVTGTRWLGAITPLGGVCFLCGWVCFGASAFRVWRG